MKNICLIGLPLSGKTFLGKKLAKHFNLDFYDTDDLIEKKTKLKVEDFIEKYGIKKFRSTEKKVIFDLFKNKKRKIISFGGGVVEIKNISSIIKKNSIVCFLDTNLDILKKRFKESKTSKRPLLKNSNSLSELKKIRYDKYLNISDYIIKDDFLETLKSVTRIISIENDVGFLVIGDPIMHSKSPYIHKELCKKFNLRYERAYVKEKFLSEFFKTFKSSKLRGINITSPLKEKCLEYADVNKKNNLSLNTLIKKNNKLYGENTDYYGFIRSFENKNNKPLENKNVVCLGFGSVLKTFIPHLLNESLESLNIFVRDLKKAKEFFSSNVKTFDLLKIGYILLETKNNLYVLIENDKYYSKINFLKVKNIKRNKSVLNSCDLFINFSSIGLNEKSKHFNYSFLDNLNKKCLVYDLNYNPKMSKLLEAAKTKKCRVKNGDLMLKYQAMKFDSFFK